ncbi:metallophosphoesterase [Granulicella sp. WH15]|uniref:metallophosphoesterase n=1 Tax=Granulicella sp. WH15 TaxID=2602070 RepID=UPI001366EEE1|nr:metallophosphoesterase [Granulicella sp. WH15]QHN03146.1 metallophosphoesterase [Granulicella sp. WH15]
MQGDPLTEQDSTPESFDSQPPHGFWTRRRFLLASGLSAAGFALYSGQIARHEIDLTHITVPIRDLPHAFDGFRIAQISDLHLEEFTEEYFLRHVVERVNALAPDLVLVTGDFISDGPRSVSYSLKAAVRCGEILHGLTCPLRFGCLGNHDASVGSQGVIERIRPSGLRVLVNEHIPIERQGQRLWLAALDDLGHGNPSADLAVPERPDGPVILMAHEPDYAVGRYKKWHREPVDLILSGHSHGGQVRLPGGRPLTLPPGASKYYDGLYQVGPTQLYVNRGIGTVGVPFRLNCPPEITLHTLAPV